MTLVIGTDEAGYGPNLGPLVVAATAWQLKADASAAEASFAGLAVMERNGVRPGALWADSKAVYRGGAGFAALEHGAHAALALTGCVADDWPALAAALGAIEPDATVGCDIVHLRSLALPRSAARDACQRTARAIATMLDAAGIGLVGIAARAIHPAEFNHLLDQGRNKSDILSEATLDLAAGLRGRCGPDETVVWCDRHGGRKSYASIVARHFAVPLLQTVEETAARSVYAAPGDRLRIEFTVGGESRLPVAVASMTAKYVRELAMTAFNACWQERMPGLAPTAGYPVDARRWLAEAAAAIREAGIPTDHVWRRV